MNSLELKNIIAKITGLRLTQINLACEMMMFHFENYAIHTQCLTRIIKDNDILVTTFDYQSWDGEVSENNDEWYNLNKYKPSIIGGKVISIEVTHFYDLLITLDNGVAIQIIIGNSYAHFDEEKEQYRFFGISSDAEIEKHKFLQKHYVIYSKHIDLE